MKFHICNIEPPDYPYGHFLDDACRLFCYSLESLGHSCTMGCNELEPGCMNIVFCGQFLKSPEHVNELAGACRYIAIQHEVLNHDGLNLTGDSRHLDGVYFPFLRRAFAVWEGLPSNLVTLQRLGVRASGYHGGYHPRLREVPNKRDQDIDFLFYGSITPHRRQMLERLTERGHRVVAAFAPRQPYRNDLIGRAKVQLAPIQGPSMTHFAYGRVTYLLNNDRLVVAERCHGQEWLEHCFVSAATEHWVDVCEQTLQRSDRNQIAAEFSCRFQEIPFTEQMQRLLHESFERDGGAPGTPAPSERGPIHSAFLSADS